MEEQKYCKYNMSSFDADERKKVGEKRFPEDLRNAYSLGYENTGC